MKINFFAFLGAVLLCFSCSEPGDKYFTVKGKITGAENMNIYIEKYGANSQFVMLADTMISAEGDFHMDVRDSKAGDLIQLRVGNRSKIYLVNTGPQVVEITSELNDLRTYSYTIGEGSPDNIALSKVFNQLATRQMNSQQIKEYLSTATEPISAAFICLNTQQDGSAENLAAFEKSITDLQTAYPESDLVGNMNKIKGQLVQRLAMAAQSPIKVGAPAPDITMNNPNGKPYSLSDLKGQVVLLDFWASWCGPCRRENPNVVKVYEKYKDQGFTVFSVSLDGLDARTKARFNGDEARIAQELERSRDKWIAAIEKDGLPWEYHVSDLKKWESDAGRQYGVRSIPYTVLIDREGNIAALKLRGAASIEAELQKLL